MRPVRRFPGLYCPGLIEAPTVNHPRTGPDMFPGLYCPGLIEATETRSGSASDGAVSGALLPRPH